MVRSNVRVLLRTRPTDNFASDAVHIDGSNKTVSIKHGVKTFLGDRDSNTQLQQFKFDGVLHNATQEAVFEATAAEVVAGALRGYNGAIMCYGQTGAGKTYTMTGGRSAYAQRGLIPRTIAALLAALRSAPGLSSWTLGVSYLEIYNEALYDLLDISTQPQDLVLYEDGKGTLQVSGLRKVAITTEQDALALFFEGETNRVIGEHQLNRASSRSHCIFCLELQLVPEGGTGQALTSKVTLVDLAGSERVSKTRSDGQVLREAGYINKSLHMLEQVVLAASDKGRDHVPYRSCKLTHVLKDCLGGNCNTVLVANIWGEAAQLEETLSTCRFAARMSRMTAEVISNIMSEGGARVRQLEREVQELQEELAMMALFWGSKTGTGPAGAASLSAAADADADGDAQGGQSQQQQSPYAPLSEQQRQQLRQQVLQWLTGPEPTPASLAPLPLTNMRQLREVLYACKHLYQQAHRAQVAEQQGMGSSQRLPAGAATTSSYGSQLQSSSYNAVASSSSSSSYNHGAAAAAGAGSGRQAADPQWSEYVGEVDAADQSGGVGLAPEDARPGDAPPMSASGSSYGQGHSSGSGGQGSLPARGWQGGVGTSSGSGRWQPASTGAAGGNRDASLDAYRAGPGADKAQLLNDNHAKMVAAKRRQKELALALNATKGRIDALRQQQEELKAARLAEGGEAAQTLSDAELGVLEDLAAAKAAYKEDWGELSAVKSEVEYTSGLVEACKRELMEDFQAWQQQQQQQAPPSSEGYTSSSRLGPGRPSGLTSPPGAHMGGGGSSSSSSMRAMQPTGTPTGGGSLRVGSRSTTPPLASLLTSLSPEEASDPAAQVYYQAGMMGTGMWGRAQAGGLNAATAKQHRGERGTFTHTGRSNISEQFLRARAVET